MNDRLDDGRVDEQQPPQRSPLNVFCSNCGHHWTLLYMPMELHLAAAILRSAHCPDCGMKRGILIDAGPDE